MMRLARWTSDPKVDGSMPCLGRRVVSLDKKLYSTLSLYTQVYKLFIQDVYCKFDETLELSTKYVMFGKIECLL